MSIFRNNHALKYLIIIKELTTSIYLYKRHKNNTEKCKVKELHEK